MMPPLIVILGPTASGKTDWAIKLAKKFSGEIICADSRTIFRDFNIGTGKPYLGRQWKRRGSRVMIENIPHYFVDILRPNQEYTAAQFKKEALRIIKDIEKRDHLPFLVGGTGLYIQAVIDNLQIPAVAPDKKLRRKLEQQAARYGWKFLWKKLIKLDPGAKALIDKNNPRRIIRALEVCLKTSKPFTKLRQKGSSLFNVLQIGINMPRKKLYQKIDRRVEQMIKQGLVEEAERLGKRYGWDAAIMNSIGYQEMREFHQGRINLKEAVQKIKNHTHNLARRQMTWFRRDERINWLRKRAEAKKLIQNFLKKERPAT